MPLASCPLAAPTGPLAPWALGLLGTDTGHPGHELFGLPSPLSAVLGDTPLQARVVSGRPSRNLAGGPGATGLGREGPEEARWCPGGSRSLAGSPEEVRRACSGSGFNQQGRRGTRSSRHSASHSPSQHTGAVSAAGQTGLVWSPCFSTWRLGDAGCRHGCLAGHSQSPHHRAPEFSRPRVLTWPPEEPDPSCLGAPKAPEKGPQAPLLIVWSLCLWRCLAAGPSHPGWWPCPDIRPQPRTRPCPALYLPSLCQNCPDTCIGTAVGGGPSLPRASSSWCVSPRFASPGAALAFALRAPLVDRNCLVNCGSGGCVLCE